jgi:hypothetical protein
MYSFIRNYVNVFETARTRVEDCAHGERRVNLLNK